MLKRSSLFLFLQHFSVTFSSFLLFFFYKQNRFTLTKIHFFLSKDLFSRNLSIARGPRHNSQVALIQRPASPSLTPPHTVFKSSTTPVAVTQFTCHSRALPFALVRERSLTLTLHQYWCARCEASRSLLFSSASLSTILWRDLAR